MRLMADGMKDFEYLFIFLMGATKQRPEGIIVNSEDRMWLCWEIIPLALWVTCLSHKELKSLCWAPIILEQTLTML